MSYADERHGRSANRGAGPRRYGRDCRPGWIGPASTRGDHRRIDPSTRLGCRGGREAGSAGAPLHWLEIVHSKSTISMGCAVFVPPAAVPAPTGRTGQGRRSKPSPHFVAVSGTRFRPSPGGAKPARGRRCFKPSPRFLAVSGSRLRPLRGQCRPEVGVPSGPRAFSRLAVRDFAPPGGPEVGVPSGPRRG